MSHELSRYFDNLDDDGKSGRRPAVSGAVPNGCPGPDNCRERTGGAVLVVMAVVAILGVTVGLITGCAIGSAKAKHTPAATIEAAP